jgi:hypothetical protein
LVNVSRYDGYVAPQPVLGLSSIITFCHVPFTSTNSLTSPVFKFTYLPSSALIHTTSSQPQ